jgi:hypothetical protein
LRIVFLISLGGSLARDAGVRPDAMRPILHRPPRSEQAIAR